MDTFRAVDSQMICMFLGTVHWFLASHISTVLCRLSWDQEHTFCCDFTLFIYPVWKFQFAVVRSLTPVFPNNLVNTRAGICMHALVCMFEGLCMCVCMSCCALVSWLSLHFASDVWNFPSSVKKVNCPHVGYLVVCGWEGRKLLACLTLKKSCRFSMYVMIHLRRH